MDRSTLPPESRAQPSRDRLREGSPFQVRRLAHAKSCKWVSLGVQRWVAALQAPLRPRIFTVQPPMIVEYPELKAFSGPMMVVGHGRTRRSSQREALIKVIFAPARWWRSTQTEPAEPTSVAVEIGIGHLPHFPVGRVFEPNKEPVDEVHGHFLGKDRAVIKVRGSTAERAAAKFGTSEPRWFEQSGNFAPPYPTNLIKDAPLFKLDLDINGHKIFVSPIELVRAFYGFDSDLLRLVVEGGVHNFATTPELLIDPDASYRDADQPSTVYIKAYRELSPSEVRFAVRVVAENRLKIAFRQVFAGLQQDAWMHNPTYVNTIYPFERDSNWTCSWRWISIRDGKMTRNRCLVTRIHAIDYDLGVEKVVVSYPIFEDAADDGASPRKYVFDAPRSHTDRITTISGAPSSRFVPPIERWEGTADSGDPWTTITVGVPEESHRRISAAPRELDELIEYGSTGSFGRTRKATAKMRTTTDVPPEDIARTPHPHILLTAAALEKAAKAMGWSFEWIKPESGPGSDVSDRLHRYPDFYRAATPPIALPWSRLRSGLQRRALVCRLKIENRVVVVVDAEHEIVAEGLRAQQDGNSRIGILALRPGDNYYKREIESTLGAQSFHRGVWRKSMVNAQMAHLDTQVHEETWFADPTRYAAKLKDRLIRAVTGAPRA